MDRLFLRPVRTVGLLACALSACAGDAGARREVVSLRRQVDQLRAKSIRDLRTIRELENRVFVLEDRLETAKVQGQKVETVEPVDKAARAPKLPVVTRRPVAEVAPPPDPAPTTSQAAAPLPPAPPPHAVGSPSDSEVEIVYEGDALVTNASRPRFSLSEWGSADHGGRAGEPPARRTRRARSAAPLPDPAAVTDKIPIVPLPEASPRRPADDPAASYKEAFTTLQRREHAAAIGAFEKFLARWPRHDYADNAQYWLGEARYDQRDYKLALLEFQKVIERYPEGNKAPDALLKVGFCHANLGEVPAARNALSQLIESYPRSYAARLAQKRLEELRR